MRSGDFLDSLRARGRHHFTTEEAVAAFGGRIGAVQARLRRLKQRGRIASPLRSFHVIIPPEHRRLGCLPGAQFIDQLMTTLGEPYYIALLSAAERHGAAHQRPQSLQVMVQKNRAPIECGQVRVVFIARGDLARASTVIFNTPRGTLRCATPETTALELVGYPRHAGGLSNAATVLAELAEEIRADRLVEAAAISPIAWSQRLGYLFELLEEPALAEALAPVVTERAWSDTPLRRLAKMSGATRDPKWKLIVNVDVEPDQ